ncbi:MAG: 2-succinyl-5-enolpyruvyl-6-hydroxy-3-cyclohexene-1-carboxylic-acid synthase [Candidatus Margulisiibacteriota bacterium]
MNTTIIAPLIKLIKNAGVEYAFIGAGSRSTALIQEIDHQGIKVNPFFDERAVAFIALGYTKISQKPSLIVTTSGSAVSNLYPAITEAANSYYPLIVLTADRPRRLQLTSANQTINQTKKFNNVIAEIHVPESCDQNNRFMDQVNDALLRQNTFGGVIHINCPLEDPVAFPYNPENNRLQQLPKINSNSQNELLSIQIINKINAAKSGLLCIGQTEPFVNASDIQNVIKFFNWPTVVDVTHHSAKQLPNVAQSADDAAVILDQCEPDLIIYIGGPWVSKKMAQYIEQQSTQVIHISKSYRPVVPLPQGTSRISLNALCGCQPLPSSILDINQLNQITKNRIANDCESEFSQIRNVFLDLPQVDCFIANSQPIRYVDQLCLPNVRDLFCNRGASGIDGNIATIAGLCMIETSVPIIGIVGDLAALYDLNAFICLKQARRPFIIIILNNGGGGIFEKLPIARTYEKFDSHFKLKHQQKLVPILKGMGIECHQVTKLNSLNIKKTSKVIEILV